MGLFPRWGSGCVRFSWWASWACCVSACALADSALRMYPERDDLVFAKDY